MPLTLALAFYCAAIFDRLIFLADSRILIEDVRSTWLLGLGNLITDCSQLKR